MIASKESECDSCNESGLLSRLKHESDELNLEFDPFSLREDATAALRFKEGMLRGCKFGLSEGICLLSNGADAFDC